MLFTCHVYINLFSWYLPHTQRKGEGVRVYTELS